MRLKNSRERQIFPWTLGQTMKCVPSSLLRLLLIQPIYVPIYSTPKYIQFAHDTSALHAGVCLLPYVAFFVTASLSNGFLVSKALNLAECIDVGTALYGVFFGLFNFDPSDIGLITSSDVKSTWLLPGQDHTALATKHIILEVLR